MTEATDPDGLVRKLVPGPAVHRPPGDDPHLAALAARHRALADALDRCDAVIWLLDPSEARDRLETAADAIREAVDQLDDRLTKIAAGDPTGDDPSEQSSTVNRPMAGS
jgi:hypothetical protein